MTKKIVKQVITTPPPAHLDRAGPLAAALQANLKRRKTAEHARQVYQSAGLDKKVGPKGDKT